MRHRLYCPPARIFIAVEQHSHEQWLSLSARNVKKRRALQMPPKVRGWHIKQRVGKMIEAAEARQVGCSNVARCTMHANRIVSRFALRRGRREAQPRIWQAPRGAHRH